MNILGINGLGVSPSACLVQEGNLVALAQEERFNRIKGSFGFMPVKAARFCLESQGLKLKDIDYIAFSWDANKYRFYMPYFFLYTYIRHAPKFQSSFNFLRAFEQITKYSPSHLTGLINQMLGGDACKESIPPVIFVPHHLAHAATSFYTSGFDQAYILIIDGSGEDYSTTIFKGTGSALDFVFGYKAPNSLGWFYQSITEFLGFIPNRQEGKTMALASYGSQNEEVARKIEKMLFLTQKGYRHAAQYSFLGKHSGGKVYSDQMVSLLGRPRNYQASISSLHKSIAYQAQNKLEEVVSNLVKRIAAYPGYRGNLCLSGGVGLNCKLNGAIAGMDFVRRVSVSPFPSDAGTCLGAALYLSQKKGFSRKFKLEHPYWGPFFSCQDVEKILINCKVKFEKRINIEKTVADLIFQDKIVGWFQGRMEAGPRALGNRSILANPLKNHISGQVNKKVKNREIWRPFAPSILYEKRSDYVIDPQEAPFMAVSFQVPEKVKKEFPAVVHVDSSTRPHFVKKNINLRFWKVIDEFRKKTGKAALLNTSFNLRGEPIVCTPEDALKAFYASGLDYLVIEDFLVYKE
jgi:carbamoyltransferase